MLSIIERLIHPQTQRPPIPDSLAFAKAFLLEYRQKTNAPFTVQTDSRLAMDIHARLTPHQIAMLIMQGLLSRDFPIPPSRDN